MSLEESFVRLAADVARLVRELARRRNLDFPLSPPPWRWDKFTVQTEKVLTTMGTFITFETTVRQLPVKEGRNADIVSGLFMVVVDGVEYSRHTVAYDLESRQATGPVAWRAPKGSAVQLRLAYVDDDGNLSSFTDTQFGVVTDTIAPDAPTEVGETRMIAEVEE